MRVLLLFALTPVGLYGQETPAADPVIRLNVQQVLVPVIVSDKKGHHVTGLHQSDFRILEDGVLQSIAAFSTDTAASVDDVIAHSKIGSDVAPASSSAKEPRRTFVICIDALHSSPAGGVRVREALEEFFHDQKGTDAQYVLIAIGRRLQVLQTATTNPVAILTKIRAPGFPAAVSGPDSAALAAQLNNLHTRMEQFCRSCSCGMRANQRACDSDVDTLKQSIDGDAQRWTALNAGLAAQFKSVVENLAQIPTARTLLLLSDGFNLDPKREFYAEAATWLPANPQFRLPDGGLGEPAIAEALKIASDRNVVIYGLDSHGAVAPTFSRGGTVDASGSGSTRGGGQSVSQRGGSSSTRSTTLEAASEQSAKAAAVRDSATLTQLVNATGGVYWHDGKDLAKNLQKAVADGREYYLLAYVPTQASPDGKFRRITVEVQGKNLNVRAKAGYWAGRSDQ